MKRGIIVILGVLVLMGLVGFVIGSIEKTMDFPGTTLSGNFIGSEVVIFSDSWNLIYGFPNPEWISGGDVMPKHIKAIYAFNPIDQEYIRFYPSPETNKIANSNFAWSEYMKITAFFVLTDYSARNTGEMKYWTLEPAKSNDIQLLSGWNLIGVTSNFEGKSINQIKGDCDILRIYTFQNNKWVNLEDSKDESSLLYAFDGTKNIGLAIKVARDCNLESSGSVVGPPELPGGNEITGVYDLDCVDTDGGLDYFNKGIATYGEFDYEDSCGRPGTVNVGTPEEYTIVEGDVIEYACYGSDGDKRCSTYSCRFIQYNCPNGCQDGACIQ
jgi:hypothetical protein